MSPFTALIVSIVTGVLIVRVKCICSSSISCPCGSSGRNYTLCLDGASSTENPCEVWSRCQTCEDGKSHCTDCPEGFVGATCSQAIQEESSRVKRQISKYRNRRYRTSKYQNQDRGRSESSHHHHPVRSGYSCSNVESPKLGSLRCSQEDDQRVCVGKCLPGYAFEDQNNVEEMTLRCRRGSWTPMNSFPRCKNQGKCDLEMNGAGAFNCTIGMEGTRCDVHCDGHYSGRYFCYPGRDWEPSLPFCVRRKGGAAFGESRASCRCENGGTCDEHGICHCPEGREGSYCEIIAKEEKYCPDPGFIPEGSRMRSDGSPAAYVESFKVGETLVFSCNRRGYALQGPSLLTCLPAGIWSDPLPRCVRSPVSKIECSDPGTVENADRLNTDGSSSDGFSDYEAGQSVVYTCRRNYALHGSSLLTCLRNGQWSSVKPHCTRVITRPRVTTTTEKADSNIVYCNDPGLDPNGERRSYPYVNPRSRQIFPQGSRLEYSCNDGYDLQGEQFLFCLLTGEWSASVPKCQPKLSSLGAGDLIYCENPGPITNGRITIFPSLDERRRPEAEPQSLEDPTFPEGTRLQYSCDLGYETEGPNSITCDPAGFWSADPPTCVGECGHSFLRTTRKITYGTQTFAGEWPWMVALFINEGNNSRYICGGVLLNERTVLTAAHCLENDKIKVYFGKFHIQEKDDDKQVQIRKSSKVIPHPKFNSTVYDSDVGVIRFSPKIRFSDRIQPICLPTPKTTARNLSPGTKGYVTGWGLTEFHLQTDELLMAHLPVISAATCMKSYERQGIQLNLTSNMFCAGLKQGMTSACTGDSGSPFVFYNSTTDRHTLEGLVSFGVVGQCGLPEKYVVFTKVSPFVPWILRNMS